MKKIVIAFVCMIMATGAAMAQKSFTFGPKIGVDYTHFWGKDTYHDGQLNYQIGAFFEYRITDKFSVAPEVVFAAQGGRDEMKSVNLLIDDEWVPVTDYKLKDNINYINVPVMLKYYVVPELSIDFGPQIAYCVYSKYTEEYKYEDNGVKNKETYDQKEETKDLEFAVGLGLTYNIAKDVFVQGRYTLGITNVFDYGKTKNGNAQIAIGYRF